MFQHIFHIKFLNNFLTNLKVDIDNEKEEKNLKKAFQVVQNVVQKLYEENATSLELFEEEIDKASKKG